MAERTDIPRWKDPMERLPRQPRDILKLLEPIALFDELNLRERSMMAEVAEVVRCSGGTKLYEAGDEGRYLYCVLQGRLELRTTIGTGLTHGVREVPVGRLAGLDAVLTQQPYHLACAALENTAALRFHTSQLHQLLSIGTPAAIKLFAAMRTELGNDIRTATLQVVKLLEATSVRGST
jgi:CRP-like cAMP-binding protein